MQFLESSGKVDGKVAPGFQEGVMRVVGGEGFSGSQSHLQGFRRKNWLSVSLLTCQYLPKCSLV